MGQFEMSLEHIKTELGLPKSYDKLCNLNDTSEASAIAFDFAFNSLLFF